MSDDDDPRSSPTRRRELLDFYRKAYITAMMDAGWDLERIRAQMRHVDAFIAFLNTGELRDR